MDNDVIENLLVDPDNMDEEVIKQPGLYYYYAKKHSRAVEKAEALRLEIDELYAELYAKFRKKYEDEKPTEGFIRNEIIKNRKYKKIQREFLQLRRRASDLGSLKVAMAHKKDMLELRMRMMINDLHSNLTSKDVRKFVNQLQTNKVRKKLREKIKKKRRE